MGSEGSVMIVIDFVLGCILGAMAGLLIISTGREYGEPTK
jgi:hypothetical protein